MHTLTHTHTHAHTHTLTHTHTHTLTHSHTHTHKGEMIDRIEHNVENAAVHVDRGRKEIRTAVQYKKKNRRVSNRHLLHVSV